MLFGMAFVAVSSIMLHIAAIVITLLLMPAPYKYVLVTLLTIVSLAYAYWLYHIIGEIYADMPKRRPRKRKPKNTGGHRLTALVVIEIIFGVSVYILYSNGIKIPAPGIVAILLIGGLSSLLF